MKRKVRTIYTSFLSFFLILLGFSGCGKDDSGLDDIMIEYGTPTATFKVVGKVTSKEAAEKGIKGIQVVMIPNTDMEHIEGTTVLTDESGSFSVERYQVPYPKIIMKFQDVDKEENGLFADKEITVEFTREDIIDSNRWHDVYATKDMGIIQLDSQKIEEEK